MKTCCGCDADKPLDDFYRNKNQADGRQPRCKVCMRSAYNESRAKKKEHYRNVQVIRERVNMDRLNDWKRQHGCSLCPEDEPYVLDPHHLDPNEKDYNISTMARSLCWETLQEELNKCILVCRNCHGKIHAGIIKV